MLTREQLHQLIDAIPEDRLPAAEAALESLVDPMLRALTDAEADDEPSSPEEDQSTAEAWAAYRRGDFLSADDAKRQLLDS